MGEIIDFSAAGRIPTTGDNVAIAVRRLEAGTQIACGGSIHTISHTILEGHRFAIQAIAPGAPLLSWGLPFGRATEPIAPGAYVCNPEILEALAHRAIDFLLPARANFENWLEPFHLDAQTFRPGAALAVAASSRSFLGYSRPGNRGTGTRNFILILATTSLTAGYARALEQRFKGVAGQAANIDGIVAVTHTEGGSAERPNNYDLVLRTLAGFIVHPNTAAALVIDYGTESITNSALESFMAANGYQAGAVPHKFFSLRDDFQSALDEGESTIRSWLARANAQVREPRPVSELKLALQCGGSDAFSGISGNPLVGLVAKEVLRCGGSANLAETDELIGAEAYILSNTKDLTTARKFLEKIANFKERARWHGHTAEGNPSGGNKFRGLYNIALKSIGAARKKDPEVRLDDVIDYAQPMGAPGYYFMDSPGNDLESIAGQVSSGANVIFFITGNGSITNFPFVPTIKVVTTTSRFERLSQDMDINAGRYLDGTPMSDLAQETFDVLLRVASGRPSAGERAGHAQVSIWRNWRQSSALRLEELRTRPRRSGRPLAIPEGARAVVDVACWATARGPAGDQVGLIVPTSLCAAQVAQKIAHEMNAQGFAEHRAISRMVALVHTEGCGASGGENEAHLLRTLVGHLLHRNVARALLLEHGCEKIHNDAMRRELRERNVDAQRFGWASIQMDGGIDAVAGRIEAWFAAALPAGQVPATRRGGAEALALGMTAVREVPAGAAQAMARLAAGIVRSGGTVVIAENASLLREPAFREALASASPLEPTLEYGQAYEEAGLYIMATPTDDAMESLTGLGATGVQTMLAHTSAAPLRSHPMIPLLQVTSDPGTARRFGVDLDGVIAPGAEQAAAAATLLDLIARTASRTYRPRLWAKGNTDFQVTRGWLGLSM